MRDRGRESTYIFTKKWTRAYVTERNQIVFGTVSNSYRKRADVPPYLDQFRRVCESNYDSMLAITKFDG